MTKINQEKLAEIRRITQARSTTSLTTGDFQNQLLDFIVRHADQGDSIIEIGVYQGGMTSQLAYLAQVLGKKLYCVDIYTKYINIAKETLAATVPDADVTFFHGNFKDFVATHSGKLKPIIVFVDGDHTYEGAKADALSLYDMQPLPFAAAFHDFALRGTETQVDGYTANVNGALYDCFGRDFSYEPMGEISGVGPNIHSYPWSEEDAHYHIPGNPEAVLIYCAQIKLLRAA